MNDLNPQVDELDVPDALPPALLEALRAFDGPTPMPDASRREQVLAQAREHFADVRQGHRRRLIFRFAAAGTALASAAAIAIVLFIGGPADPVSTPGPLADNTAPAVTGDANRDGTVDAGDLLKLGQALARGETPAGADLNDDGVFNQRDVDAVAAIAVDLNLERGVELSAAPPIKRGFFAIATVNADRGGEQ